MGDPQPYLGRGPRSRFIQDLFGEIGVICVRGSLGKHVYVLDIEDLL